MQAGLTLNAPLLPNRASQEYEVALAALQVFLSRPPVGHAESPANGSIRFADDPLRTRPKNSFRADDLGE